MWQNWILLALTWKTRICTRMGSSESRVRKNHLSTNIRRRLQTGTAVRGAIQYGRKVRKTRCSSIENQSIPE